MFFDYLIEFQEFIGKLSFINGIKNVSGIEMIVKFLILYSALFWFAIVVWVARDAINRSNSIIFHVISILLSIFLPIFGLVIYLLIRPPRTLLDRYYEDLEFQSLSNDTKDFCHKCHAIIGQDYKFCGECGEELMCLCVKCNREFFKRYGTCPYCGHKKGKKFEKKEEIVEEKIEHKLEDKSKEKHKEDKHHKK